MSLHIQFNIPTFTIPTTTTTDGTPDPDDDEVEELPTYDFKKWFGKELLIPAKKEKQGQFMMLSIPIEAWNAAKETSPEVKEWLDNLPTYGNEKINGAQFVEGEYRDNGFIIKSTPPIYFKGWKAPERLDDARKVNEFTIDKMTESKLFIYGQDDIGVVLREIALGTGPAKTKYN